MGISDQTDASRSIDAALIALTRDQIWRGDEASSRPAPPAEAETPPPNLAPVSLINRLRLAPDWSLTLGALGFLALMPLAAAALLWGSLYGQVERARVSTSSASKELAAKALPLKSAEAEPRAATSETSPQTTQSIANSGAAIVPLASAQAPDLQSVTTSTSTRPSADAQQAIEKLAADQARMLSENAELNEQLKAAREITRQNERLMEDLKATQSQLVQEKVRLEAQLQASEQQVTNIAAKLSASQDDVARMEAKLKGSQAQTASLPSQNQQKQPPRLLSHSTNPPTKPVPTASLRQPKPTPSPNPANSRARTAQKGAVAGSARPPDTR